MSEESHARQERATGPIVHLVGRRSAEEDRAWAHLYATIQQPAIAEEVVRHLDADPQAKRDRPALYIQARATLRQRKLSAASVDRIVARTRRVLSVLLATPWRLLAGEYALIRDTVLAALPAARQDPVAVRARPCPRDPALSPTADLFRSLPGEKSTSASTSRHAA